MKKIKTVYKIDRGNNLATEEVNKGAEWVVKGKGIATLKVDGSACLVKDGELYKRYDRKLKSHFVKQLRSQENFVVTEDMFNEIPADAIPCQEKPDPVTYHHPHWVKIDSNKAEDKFHVEALNNFKEKLSDGTYELIGSKINNNPYGLESHVLVKHGAEILNVPDRSFEGIKSFLENLNGEGIVFYNEETGDMAKIRRKDMCKDLCKVEGKPGELVWTPQIDHRNQVNNDLKKKKPKKW